MDCKVICKGITNASPREHCLDNGECLSKMPTATAEQLTIAKILSKREDDVNLRSFVLQIQELTKCSEDQAVTALYDCENNLERAVELVLDKFRCGVEEEWRTNVAKRGKSKHASEVSVASVSGKMDQSGQQIKQKEDELVQTKQQDLQSNITSKPKVVSTVDPQAPPKILNARSRSGRSRPTSSAMANGRQRVQSSLKHENNEKNELPKTSAQQLALQPETEVWDPYADYGVWMGEPIEILNSNTSVSEGFQEPSKLSTDLLAEASANVESQSTIETHGTFEEIQSLEKDFDPDALFVHKARSKPPPPAFRNLPDVPVFIVPELLQNNTLSWQPIFGGESLVSSTNHLISKSSALNSNKNGDNEPLLSGSPEQVNNKASFPYVPQVSHQASSNDYGLKSTNSPHSLPHGGKKEETPSIITPEFSNKSFKEHLMLKANASFASTHEKQTTTMAPTVSDQNAFLEPTLKNYLDGLPDNMNKLGVGESSSKSQYNIHPNSSAQPMSNFSHNQSGGQPTSQLSKISLSHAPSHSSGPTQAPLASGPQPSQQTAASLPPGIPHFINQFTPAAYHMFNLPGNANAAHPLFDLDQIQFMQQQQRMLYDMQLQHSASTTAQSLLTANVDSTGCKNPSYNMPPMTHVSAPSTNIRPELLAPALGHAAQMMTPGHPYFPYSGFVFMNGYPNAFVNQQQQSSSESAQPPSSAHCVSPIPQHQPQQSNPGQNYGNLKHLNSGVDNYEDLLDLKYNDPSKQVGFKVSSTHSNFGPFQAQPMSLESVGDKLATAAHSVSGQINQSFNHANDGPHAHHFPQFYPSAATASHYFTAMAAAAAAVAHQSSNNTASVTGNQSAITGSASAVSNNGPNQMHLSAGSAQGMMLGQPGSNLHHQRPSMQHH